MTNLLSFERFLPAEGGLPMTGSGTARRVCRCLVLWGLVAMLAVSASAAGEKSPLMEQYGVLSAQYVQLRDEGVATMTAGELVTASDQLIAQLTSLVEAASADPLAKSKGQRLLSDVYHFAGAEPESRAAYSGYLDTLDGWRGRDYAVMAVRRAGHRQLTRKQDPTRALLYYDLMLEKYASHGAKAEVLYHSGLACLENGEVEEAAQRLGQAFAADPEGYWGAWALRKKAFALYCRRPSGERIRASLRTLDELAELFPAPHWKAYVYYRKGFILASQEKYLEALTQYTQGIEQYPSSPYSEMGKKHVAMIQEILESKLLDDLAHKKTPGDELPEEVTAPPPSIGHVSMLFPDGEGLEGGPGR